MRHITDQQRLADHLDQLDLAVDQLALNDRNYTRFAFMLVDNVAELVLHSYVVRISSVGALKVPRPKQQDGLVAQALGQHFHSKAKFAKRMGYITDDEESTVGQLHKFRNTVYHQGAHHEGLLHSLALLYIRTVSLILERDKLCWIAQATSDAVSHRARKYLGEVGHFDSLAEKFQVAWSRLRHVCNSIRHDVVRDLAREADAIVAEADEAIRFLAEDGSYASRADVVRKVQREQLAFTEKCVEFATKKGFDLNTDVVAYLDWLDANYPWEFRSDPIDSWRKRAAGIRSEQNEHAALKKYCDFLRQTDGVRSAIHRAEGDLAHGQELRWEQEREDRCLEEP